MAAIAPNSAKEVDHIEASVYMLKKEEGGRGKPIMAGYIQPFMVHTANVDCYVTLPEDKDMLLGGDFANIKMYLKYPLVLNPGDKFTGQHIIEIHRLLNPNAEHFVQ